MCFPVFFALRASFRSCVQHTPAVWAVVSKLCVGFANGWVSSRSRIREFVWRGAAVIFFSSRCGCCINVPYNTPGSTPLRMSVQAVFSRQMGTVVLTPSHAYMEKISSQMFPKPPLSSPFFQEFWTKSAPNFIPEDVLSCVFYGSAWPSPVKAAAHLKVSSAHEVPNRLPRRCLERDRRASLPGYHCRKDVTLLPSNSIIAK